RARSHDRPARLSPRGGHARRRRVRSDRQDGRKHHGGCLSRPHGRAPMTGMARKKERARREKLRAERFLLRGPASLRPSVGGQRALLECEDRGAISIGCADLKEMVRDGLVRAEHGRLCLSPEGRAFLRRADMPDHAFQAQPDEIAVKTVEVDGRLETVTANLSESPLAQLARRRTRNGEPFLTAEEFNAGERLRADYTRGQIMPRIGMNWQA